MKQYIFHSKELDLKIYAEDMGDAIAKFWHKNNLKNITKIEEQDE